MHQKCCNYALTNLLFGLCKSLWVIDLLVSLPSPYLGAPARPSTPEMLRAKEHTPTLHYSDVFTLDSHLNLLRSLGVRLISLHYYLWIKIWKIHGAWHFTWALKLWCLKIDLGGMPNVRTWWHGNISSYGSWRQIYCHFMGPRSAQHCCWSFLWFAPYA